MSGAHGDFGAQWPIMRHNIAVSPCDARVNRCVNAGVYREISWYSVGKECIYIVNYGRESFLW